MSHIFIFVEKFIKEKGECHVFYILSVKLFANKITYSNKIVLDFFQFDVI